MTENISSLKPCKECAKNAELLPGHVQAVGVFGEGNPAAKIFLLGSAGAQGDACGRPFVSDGLAAS